MKVNQVPGGSQGKKVKVEFDLSTLVYNQNGSVEFYGTSPEGDEVRLYVSKQAADDLEVELS